MDHNQVEADAIAWHTKIHHEKLTIDEIIDFENWLNKDAKHRQYYEQIKQLYRNTELFVSDPVCKEDLTNILSGGIKNKQRKKTIFSVLKKYIKNNIKLIFIEGTIAAAAFIGLFFIFQSQNALKTDLYLTEVAEEATIILKDGSKIILNTDTHVEVTFSQKTRSVNLIQGQAYFKVAKDPLRPFIVKFYKGQITALGTEFDIYLQPSQVQVTLLEGAVKLEHSKSMENINRKVKLSDQYVRVIAVQGKKAIRVEMREEYLGGNSYVSEKDATAWKTGSIIFDSEPLSNIIKEINRYSKNKISLEDKDMANIKISGHFSTNAMETVKMLEEYLELISHQDSKGNIQLKLRKNIKNK